MTSIRYGCLFAATIVASVIVAIAIAIALSAVIGAELALLVGMAVAAVGAVAMIRRLRRPRPRTTSDRNIERVRPLLTDGEIVRGILVGIEVARDRGDRVLAVLYMVLGIATLFADVICDFRSRAHWETSGVGGHGPASLPLVDRSADRHTEDRGGACPF